MKASNLEIERKILEISKVAVRKKIQSLQPAPRKIFEGLVRVKYFDTGNLKFKKRHNLLRIREFLETGKEPYAEIVFKEYRGIRRGNKVTEETQLTVNGDAAFIKLELLLKKIGFRQSKYYEKKRESYAWRQWKFDIDEYAGVPAYLEIEAPSPEEIDDAVRLLQLEDHEQSGLSISRLLRAKYPKVKLEGLVWKE